MRESSADEELLGRIFEQLADLSQRVVAFVGAGTSRAAPALVPAWAELFDLLCRDCDELGQVLAAARCRKIAEITAYHPAYLTACFDEIQEAMGQTAYETSIKRILTPKAAGIPDALRALVRVPFTGFITTNLDELIEQACMEAARGLERVPLLSVVSSNLGRGAGELATKKHWLWKIHGTIGEPDSWILTTSQYAKSIYANEAYSEALAAVVQSARLVSIGFGGSDPDIDRILRLLAKRFGGRGDPHVLLARQRENYDLRGLANRNVRVVEYGGPPDHSQLTRLLDRFPKYPPGSQVGTDADDSSYRRWLAEDVGYIEIRGIGGGSARALRFPIIDLYTDLYVLQGMANWDLSEGRIRGGQRVQLIRMLDAYRCVAIMGDPGAGKTTFLRYVARSYLDDPRMPLPFYLNLADVQKFAAAKRHHLSPDALLAFLGQRSERDGWGLSRRALRERFRTGNCIFLMDSLDLVSPHEAREDMVQVIAQSADEWDKCRFVVVSRPRAMRAGAVPRDFAVVAIDQLRKPEVAAFVGAWTDLLYADATEETRRRHAESLLSSIRDSADLRELAKNPVMLTSIAVIHYNGKRLPEARADLLEAVIDWLLHAREASTGEQRGARFLEGVYRCLALGMMEDPTGPSDRVDRETAARIVRRHFNEDENTAHAFLTAEESETGVLVARADHDIAFWHMWFQEYLAAKEIAGRTDEGPSGWWAALQGHLDDTEWHEVIAFVPACLSRLGPDRVDLFFARFAETSAGSGLATKARRAGLGSGILDDLRVVGYTPAKVPEWAALLSEVLPVFMKEGESLSLQDRYDAAVAFGRGGDSRLRSFEDTWVKLEGGTFRMGAQARDRFGPNYDPDAAPWEGPVVEVEVGPFEMRKYPITVAEFARFVLDGGYSRQDLWPEEAWYWRSDNKVDAPLDWTEQLRAPNCPVTGISWFESVAYCRWLSSLELIRNVRYGLPTEAEWEFAARRYPAHASRYPWGETASHGGRAEANFAWSDLRRKTPVGMFPRSNTADGIADMFGNVEEWCEDFWTDTLTDYPQHEVKPTERSDNPRRVVRGGSTIRFPRLCRASYRSRIRARSRYLVVGLRPVRVRGSDGRE